MKFSLNIADERKKLEILILGFVLLIIFKFFNPYAGTSFITIINDLLVFAFIWITYLYANELTKQKISSPLSLVLNAGILSAILFFITSLSSVLFDKFENIETESGIIYSLLTIVVSIFYVFSITYILSSFSELFFLRQKKSREAYFNTMLVVFSIAFFASTIAEIDNELNFIKKTFFVVAIVLISINSIRVSWIAFLSKKQKYFLLILSVVLSGLFGLNFALTFDISVVSQIIFNFSPGLQMFLTLTMLYGSIYFGIVFFTTLFHLPTAEAFDQKAEEVSSLIDFSKIMTQVFDLKELADNLTSTTNKICNADSAWLVTKNNESFELKSVSNIGYLEADKISTALFEEYSYDISELKVIDRKTIKVKIKSDVRTYNFRSLIIAPLSVHQKINGYLFAVKKQKYNFDEDEKRALGALADYTAVALENAKLFEESIEKERLESELNVAREVQYKIIPDETPECDELDVSALFVPAFEVGGDYYDFFKLGNKKLGFVIADVSGKGISAAFIMAEVKGIFESLAKLIESPKELLIETNSILNNSLEKKSFVTAVYGIIDVKKGLLNFARAGHMPVIFHSHNKIRQLQPNGIGLGLDNTDIFTENLDEMEIKLNNDDILILFTDGITESQNSAGEEFGIERFEEVIQKNVNENLDHLSNKIISEVSLFSKDKQQHDDITLVLFKWNNNKTSGDI